METHIKTNTFSTLKEYNIYEKVYKIEKQKFFLYKIITEFNLKHKSLIQQFLFSLILYGRYKYFYRKKENKIMNQLFSLKSCFISSDLFYKKKDLYVAKYFKSWFFETLYKNNQMIKEFKQKNKLHHIFLTQLKKIYFKHYFNFFMRKFNYYDIRYSEFYIKSIYFLKMLLYIIKGFLTKYKIKFFYRIIKLNEKNLNIYKHLLLEKLLSTNYSGNKYKIKNLMNSLNDNSLIEYEKNEQLLNQKCKLFQIIIKKKFYNKHICRNFKKWYINTIKLNLMKKIDLKEDYTNKLVKLKLAQLFIIIRKFLNFYFRFLIYQIKRKINSNPISLIELEKKQNIKLDKISKGFYKITKIRANQNKKYFNSSDLNKKRMCFSFWKNNKIKINIDSSTIYNNNKNSKLTIRIIKGYQKLFFLFKSRLYKYNCFLFMLIKAKNAKIIYLNKYISGINILKNILFQLKLKKIYQFFNQLQNHLYLRKYIYSEKNILKLIIILNKIMGKRLKIFYSYFKKNKKLNKNVLKRNFVSIYNSLKTIKKRIYIYGAKEVFNKMKLFIKRRNNNNNINSNILKFSKPQNQRVSMKKEIYKNISSICLSMDKEIIRKNRKLKIYKFLTKIIQQKERIKKIRTNNLNYYLTKWYNEKKFLLQDINEDKDFQSDLKYKIIDYSEEIDNVEQKLHKIAITVEKCNECSKVLNTISQFNSENKNKNDDEDIKNNNSNNPKLIKESNFDEDLDDLDILDSEMEDDAAYISYLEKTENELKNNIVRIKKEKEEEQIKLQNEIENLIKELDNISN